MIREKTMIAPVRLIDGGGDPLERELLQAARREPVPGDSRARVAQALGVSAPVPAGIGGTGSGPGGSSAGFSRAATSGAQIASVRLGMLGKVSLLGVLGGLVIFAGTGAWNARSPASPPPRVARPAALPPPLAPVPDEETHVVAATPASSPPGVPVPERVTLPRKFPAAPRSTALRSGSSADRLLAEVRQLDGVRTALRASEATQALKLLDEYAAAFPGGELAHEAQQLRHRAEQALGSEIGGSQGATRDIGRAR